MSNLATATVKAYMPGVDGALGRLIQPWHPSAAPVWLAMPSCATPAACEVSPVVPLRRDWLLQGRLVVALTAATAAIQGPSGAITLYRKDSIRHPHRIHAPRHTQHVRFAPIFSRHYLGKGAN
jgi:hypothetical protein